MIKALLFTLPECPPCNAYKASLAASEDKFEDIDLRIYDLSDPSGEVVDLAVKYNVRGGPTTVILKDNDEVYYSGKLVQTAEKLRQTIEEAK